MRHTVESFVEEIVTNRLESKNKTKGTIKGTHTMGVDGVQRTLRYGKAFAVSRWKKRSK